MLPINPNEIATIFIATTSIKKRVEMVTIPNIKTFAITLLFMLMPPFFT